MVILYFDILNKICLFKYITYVNLYLVVEYNVFIYKCYKLSPELTNSHLTN